MADQNTSPLPPELQASDITESEVLWLQDHFQFPVEYEVSVPSPEDRVVCPPDGRLAIYQDSLWGGLRFPIPEFVRSLFRFYNVVPAQLTPNSIRVVLAFGVLCFLCEIRPRTSLFRAFFVLRRNPHAEGWWCFGPRPKRVLFKGFSSSIHGWREKFFFLGTHGGWGFNTAWGEPYLDANRDDNVSDVNWNDFRTLKDAVVPAPTVLLSEQSLFNAGLSPTANLGGRGRHRSYVVFLFVVSFVCIRSVTHLSRSLQV